MAESAALIGSPTDSLSDDQARDFILAQIEQADVDDKNVVVVIPDGTRSGPHAS
nr:hypothetical protein [Corynebacterium pilosum]